MITTQTIRGSYSLAGCYPPILVVTSQLALIKALVGLPQPAAIANFDGYLSEARWDFDWPTRHSSVDPQVIWPFVRYLKPQTHLFIFDKFSLVECEPKNNAAVSARAV